MGKSVLLCKVHTCERKVHCQRRCWSHYHQHLAERAAAEAAAHALATRRPADEPGRQAFQVVTSCSVCGEIDVTAMPAAERVERRAVTAAALLMWQTLHGIDCPGAVTVELYAADAASGWSFSAEAPFLRGTIRP